MGVESSPAAPQGREPGSGFAIAMVTYRSADALAETLGANVEVARKLGAPIVVADNASDDRTLELLEAARGEYGELEVVRLARNRGYAAGVNAALAAIPGLDVLLVNPDVALPGPDVVHGLREELLSRPRAAVVAPALIDSEGHRQSSARNFPSGRAMLGQLGLARSSAWVRAAYAAYQAPSQATEPRTVDWAVGAAAFLRRAPFDELGGWDERYFLYVEDTDYCRRCWRAGWEVWFLPQFSFPHGWERRSSQEGATVLSSQARRRHVASMLRFFRRNPSLLLRRP